MDRPSLMRHALERAEAASREGDLPLGVYHATLAAGLAQEARDAEAGARARSLLLSHLFALGRFDEALLHGEAALSGWRTLGVADREAETQLRLALTLSELQLHEQALQLAHRAFETAQWRELHGQLHHALAILGGLYGRAGRPFEGERLLLQGLSRAREARDDASCTALINTLLALLLDEAERAREAGDAERLSRLAPRLRVYTGPALAQCAVEPQVFRRVVLRGNVGAALALCGQAADAAALLQAAAAQARDEGFLVAEMRVRTRLAGLELEQGNSEAVAIELDRLQALLQKEPHPAAELDVAGLRARWLALRGDAAGADLLQREVATRRAAAEERVRTLRRTLEAEAAEVLARLAAAG